jgi:hypothetical protein
VTSPQVAPLKSLIPLAPHPPALPQSLALPPPHSPNPPHQCEIHNNHSAKDSRGSKLKLSNANTSPLSPIGDLSFLRRVLRKRLSTQEITI